MTQTCPNCGIEIGSPNQKFCEKCGLKLSPDNDLEKHNIPKRKLFDLNQEYYILKNDYWKTGSGNIFDAQDQNIGFINGKKEKNVEITEVDGSITATIHFKSKSMRGASELRDNDGILIAKLKKKKVSDFNSIYFLEDSIGNRWYIAKGEFINFTFNIEDLSINKIVAECNKTEKWKKIFSGKLDYDNDYALKIQDRGTDRRILLLFVVGIRQIRSFRMF